MLFYSSVLLGVVFALFGDSLLGVIQMTTFAGALSVLTLTVVLLTGESKLSLGARRTWVVVGAGAVAVVAAAFLILAGTAGGAVVTYPDISLEVLTFLWGYRPWDLLILIMAFASAMITITNLLSRET
jgi:NADH:ubiquinone oxidoreductase subunit 6 (subunit J)